MNPPTAFLPAVEPLLVPAAAPSADGSWLLAAVVAVSRHMLEVSELDTALRLACEALQQASALDRFWVVRYAHDERAGYFVAEAHRDGLSSLRDSIGWGPFAHADYAEVFEPLFAGKVYSAPLQRKTGANHALNVASGAHADLFVPIIVEQRFWGAIGCDNCSDTRSFAEVEVDALQAAAAAIAAAIVRSQTEQARRDAEQRGADDAAEGTRRLQRHTELLAAVAASAEDLLAARDLDSGLVGVLGRVGPATSAIRAAIAQIDWALDDPDVHGWQTLRHEWTRAGAQRQSDTALVRFAMRRDDVSWARCFGELTRNGRLLAEIATLDEPFRSEQQALGVVWGVCYPLLLDGVIWCQWNIGG